MQDVVLLAVIVGFFVAASGLVRACRSIAPEVIVTEPEEDLDLTPEEPE